MELWSDKQRKEYIELAESGDTQAQMYLGSAYLLGDHLERDEQQATYWLERAEAQGSDVASFRLAFYQIHKRKKEGLARLAELQERGFPAAIYELGNCYYRGLLFDRDAEKGLESWALAAKKGHILAKIKINKHKQAGSGFLSKPIFLAKAAYWAVVAMRIIAKNSDDPRTLGHLR